MLFPGVLIRKNLKQKMIMAKSAIIGLAIFAIILVIIYNHPWKLIGSYRHMWLYALHCQPMSSKFILRPNQQQWSEWECKEF